MRLVLPPSSRPTSVPLRGGRRSEVSRRTWRRASRQLLRVRLRLGRKQGNAPGAGGRAEARVVSDPRTVAPPPLRVLVQQTAPDASNRQRARRQHGARPPVAIGGGEPSAFR